MLDSLKEILVEAKRQVEAGDIISAAKTLDNAVSELDTLEVEWQANKEYARHLEACI